jgi:hypothetical protein
MGFCVDTLLLAAGEFIRIDEIRGNRKLTEYLKMGHPDGAALNFTILIILSGSWPEK